MKNFIKHLLSRFIKSEAISLSDEQKSKLEELLYREEVAGENRLNRLILFFLTIFMGATAIEWVYAPIFHLNVLFDFTGGIIVLVYQLVMFFILRKNIYHRVFKYITATIIVSSITVILLGYSIETGWIHSLRTSTVIVYCFPIVFMGFYQRPVMPIYACVLASAEYSAMFVYAVTAKKIEIAELETFLEPTYAVCIIFVFVMVFLLCGLATSLIANRMRVVLTRSLYSETEALKKEIERQAIEKESRRKIDFFVNLAHELKTPLTLIGNYFEKYVRSKGASAESGIIKRNFDKMKRDVVNFLDLEKLERGQTFYRHDSIVDMSCFLREKCELFESLAEKKGLDFSVRIEEGLATRIDQYAIDRIVNNLLDNAIKYTDRGGNVGVDLAGETAAIRFTVKDNGIGIAASQIEHIFEPYYQVSHEKRNTQGIGLGLSIVKKIVDEIDGSINLESEPGKGTAFTVRLKRSASVEKTNPVKEAACSIPMDNFAIVRLEKESFDESKPVVLVVEDNVELLAYLRDNLASDYNVFYALDGMEALNKLEYMPYPSIIVSDIMMEVMDGYEFYDRLTSRPGYRPVPFIFLTAKTGHHDRMRGLAAGAIDYVSKPFSMDELKIRIAAILKNIEEQTEWQIGELKKTLLDVLSRAGKDCKTESIFEKCREYDFSRRETEVAALLCTGMAYKEIASRLYVSEKTASTHIQRIYQKTGVNNKMDFLKAMGKLE